MALPSKDTFYREQIALIAKTLNMPHPSWHFPAWGIRPGLRREDLIQNTIRDYLEKL